MQNVLLVDVLKAKTYLHKPAEIFFTTSQQECMMRNAVLYIVLYFAYSNSNSFRAGE